MTDTICWKCANACGGCEWSKKRAKPVAGWEAIRRDLYDGIESYIVLSCPEFEPDRPETQKESKNTRVWTADETRRLHEMRKNGITMKKCAKALNRSIDSIQKKLIRDRKARTL